MGYKPATDEQKKKQDARDLADIRRASAKRKQTEEKRAAEAKKAHDAYERDRKAWYRYRKKHNLLRLGPRRPTDGNWTSESTSGLENDTGPSRGMSGDKVGVHVDASWTH